MRLRSVLRRAVEQSLWALFGRRTSQMRRERDEWERANPHLPKPGKTYL